MSMLEDTIISRDFNNQVHRLNNLDFSNISKSTNANDKQIEMIKKILPTKYYKEEKLHVVIALGYGANQGVPHRNRALTEVSNLSEDSPRWFRDGMEAVMLAPTAINQQKFSFTQKGNTVRARTKLTFYGRMDLGIAKYHFELGAGKENFTWA